MPRFWNARLELVTQKKRKEEQAKREIEKQNRLKKKKQLKSSSTSGEEQDESHETKSELTKQQENILTKRQKYALHSSGSESEPPTSPGLALSYEMRKNELFKSQERLDEKRSPPPVLPKPKPKPKAKLPPTNKNGALPSPANKNGASTSPANKNQASSVPQPINSHAMQEIVNEISQIKLHNKKKLAKSCSSDSDSIDGNVFVKNEVKPLPKIPKKPIQHTKSLDFNEIQQTQDTKGPRSPVKPTQKSKSAEENSLKDDRMNGLLRQNAIYFEQPIDGYSKMDNNPDPSREETSSTPREILHNLKEKGANLMMNKKRVLQNICWPLGCQNGDDGQEDEDPLYSSVNFATLGYNNGTNVETYKDTLQLNIPECTTKAFPNPTYSSPNPISSSSPPKTDLSNVVQISPELGIKEVQSIVKGGTSYTVGDNSDLYALPVKGRESSDTGVVPTPEKSTSIPGKSTSGMNTPEINTPEEISPTVLTHQDTYSPIIHSPRKTRNSNSDSDKYDIAGGCEGPYAQTVLFQQSPTRPKSQYDIPGLLIDTASTTFDLKPPNFKPPPPPPGGSPVLRKKNKNKHSPPVLRNKNKVKSPKKAILKDEPLPKDKNFEFKMRRSQSESDLTSEPIFATPSSLGIPTEDNNNNRHSMFVTPKEVGKLREYFVYSDEGYENDNKVQSGKLRPNVGNGRDQIGNGRDQIGNHDNSFPAIVPPPPSSTPIIDTDSMVAAPPPHITDNTQSEIVPPPPVYPPPRLHPSERALINVNSHSDESQWQEMVESLPPPPPDLLES